MSGGNDHRTGRSRHRMIADAIWANRHTLEIDHDYGKKVQTTVVKVNPALTLTFTLQSNDGHLHDVVIRSSGHEEVIMHAWTQDPEGIMLIADAWRAAQASRMLRSLGEDDGIAGDRIELAPIRLMERIGVTMGVRRLPAYHRLMGRLDAIASSIMIQFPPDVDASHIDIGGGVTVFRHYSHGVIMHEDHGCTSHYGPGDHYPLLAATLRTLRERSLVMAVSNEAPLPPPVVPALGNAHATRMIQLCSEAVRRNPMLTDSKGTLLAPLLDKHIPDLVRIHRDASKTAHPSQLRSIDEEFDQGMEIVCRAMDEGLAILHGGEQDDARDELRRQIAFLHSRHPDTNGLGAAA